MAITPAQFLQIQSMNPTVRMQLYPDLNGVANNRIIVYGLSSNITSRLIIHNGINVTGVKVQKAVYSATSRGVRMFYKDIMAQFKPSCRYLKIQGYGTNTDITARMIEVEAFVGGVNILAGRTSIANDSASAGSANMATLTDGVKSVAANTYPIWWTTVPNANVVFDLGSMVILDGLAYYGYSLVGDQRQNRFKIQGSGDGVTWQTIWDMSANTIPQPILPNGYTLTF